MIAGSVAKIEVSWDDALNGNLPESAARTIFRQAVEDVAQKAREALPAANGRIDAAVKIVLAGDVELLDHGTRAKVASQSNGTTTYHTVNGECSCKDFPKAPANFCKHRLAFGIAKRATALTQQRLAQTQGIQHGTPSPVPEHALPETQTPVSLPVSALPEAPASANVHVTIAGRKVQITLRDQSEAPLLTRMERLLSRFPEEVAAPSAPSEGWCHKHNVQMKLHHGKKGSWWSHKTADGQWCNSK